LGDKNSDTRAMFARSAFVPGPQASHPCCMVISHSC